jgi:hypothetical protein
MLTVVLLGALLSATKAADSVQAWKEEQAVRQKAWALYESEKKQASAAYELERRRIWADYDAERDRVWKIYDSSRGRIWKAYNAERDRIWKGYEAYKTQQSYDVATRHAQKAYSQATQLSQEAYAKATAQSQHAYDSATKQSQAAYACYVAKADRAYATYLATIDRNQENQVKKMEVEVVNKCRSLSTSSQPSCRAPEQSGLEVPDGKPTCEQKWGYYLAKLVVVKHFAAMTRLLNAKEKRAIQQQEILEATMDIVGPILAQFKSEDIDSKLINVYFDLHQLLFHLIPKNDAQKIAVIWGDWALDSLQAIAINYATGVEPSPLSVVPKLVKLAGLMNELSVDHEMMNK